MRGEEGTPNGKRAGLYIELQKRTDQLDAILAWSFSTTVGGVSHFDLPDSCCCCSCVFNSVEHFSTVFVPTLMDQSAWKPTTEVSAINISDQELITDQYQ